MAVKGSIAKQKIINKIAEVFGADFIGEFDRKIYLWSEENGERVQIAISLTCPKNPVGQVSSNSMELNFENMGETKASPVNFQPAELTEDERENVRKLMERLGL